MDAPRLDRVPPALRKEAERLLGISPLFRRLTQDLDAAGWQALCRPADEAHLPGAGADWLPDTAPERG